MKKRRKIRKKSAGALSNEVPGWMETIKWKLPFRVPIIEHLIVSEVKMTSLASAFRELGFAFKETQDGRWFEVIKARTV